MIKLFYTKLDIYMCFRDNNVIMIVKLICCVPWSQIFSVKLYNSTTEVQRPKLKNNWVKRRAHILALALQHQQSLRTRDFSKGSYNFGESHNILNREIVDPTPQKIVNQCTACQKRRGPPNRKWLPMFSQKHTWSSNTVNNPSSWYWQGSLAIVHVLAKVISQEV